jgi:uncharacterized membrane protein YbhN (UPF0104 family)
MDRLLGVLAIVLCAAAGTFAIADVLNERWVLVAFVAATAGCLAGIVLVFSPQTDQFLRQVVVARAPARVADILDRVLAAVRAYERHQGVLGGVLVASVGVQVLRILQAWMLGYALGMTAPLGAYFAFVPIILLVMLLPITINGLGVSQWAFQTLFGRVGTPAPEALALSILFVALGIIGNLPGAVLYVTAPRRRQ